MVVAFADSARPVDAFDARFAASFSGGECGHGGSADLCGADGLSFVFGPLPDMLPFGPEGAGPGLRVSFMTGSSPRVDVLLAYELLTSVPAPLRDRLSAPSPMADVRVLQLQEGLSVWHDGELLVQNLTLPHWQPEPSWRFGLGASTGSELDEHAIGAISILADAHVEDHALSVEVTHNGQQYSSSAVEYVYSAPPHVSSFSPTSGPVAGNTSVLVRGARFSSQLSWRCRLVMPR